MNELDASVSRWSEVRRQIAESIPLGGMAWLHEYHQNVVLVSSWRDYWESGDGLLRVTFDRHVEIYDQWSGSRINISRQTPASTRVVLQVKCKPEREEAASRIVSSLAVPRIRCEAVQLILGR